MENQSWIFDENFYNKVIARNFEMEQSQKCKAMIKMLLNHVSPSWIIFKANADWMCVYWLILSKHFQLHFLCKVYCEIELLETIWSSMIVIWPSQWEGLTFYVGCVNFYYTVICVESSFTINHFRKTTFWLCIDEYWHGSATVACKPLSLW